MMTKRLPGFFIVLVVLSLAFSCGNDKEGKAGQRGQGQQVMPYPVIAVETRNVSTFNSYPTTLQGDVSSEVRPKISGYIQDVLVEEGQRVKRGQILFRLETQTLDQDAAAAKANVNAAQVEVNKLIPLVEKDIISPVQLESAKARLEQAKSSYQGIGANIDYANVRSPVDGVVGSINFRKGALVSTQTQLPLTRVSSVGTIYAYFSMNEKNFITFIREAEGKNMDEKIENLPKVKLILATGDEYSQEGSIETIAGDIDPQTGTISFRARFENPEGILRNGGSGTVKVPQEFTDALVVPELSTYEQQGNTYVYKVVADTLVPAALSIKAQASPFYVLQGGLAKGDSILGNGVGKVRPGTKIKPEPTPVDSIVNSFDTVFK
ncbi:efflux RND transporter periplasmic adaptor subunit [Pricia sp. S334]|uniref:Efflux RND transporter periplasmic adaptor subunit n=1 Tax=Pricia mediterranea TaxID=3076079 RepID=A0ABU3L5X5_9FLAO|nr:efflux RND transporter periplasmic adaptor subunit [Pricia sp. S334]MDT7828751.1 efflux RND transporter periplasmic adaptor subunit [Pricia sp. S334]